MTELLLAPAALLLAAAASDLRSREIPDAIPALLALSGFGWLAMLSGPQALAWGLIASLLAFALGVVAFRHAQLGGGDVKLIAALMPWLPGDRVGAFALVTAIAGGLLCLAIAAIRFASVARRDGAAAALGAARSATAPYAVAIAAGGLAALPWGRV
jgi:prepilin peptidase CpaA